MRELTKDLENLQGDMAQDYHTIPVVYGEKASKLMLTVLSVLTLVPTLLLIFQYQVGKMSYYFYVSIVLLLVFVVMLWKSNSKSQYLILHNILKLIIVLGVISIPLIDIGLVLNKITFIR